MLYFFKNKSKSNISKERVICETCKGIGETKQDVNLIMTQANLAFWMNKHIMVERCELCSKNKWNPSCEKAKKIYQEKMEDYKRNGPRMKMADCPECLGSGGYWKFNGF